MRKYQRKEIKDRREQEESSKKKNPEQNDEEQKIKGKRNQEYL